MRHRARSILAVGALLLGGAGLAPVAHAQTQSGSGTSPGPDPAEVKVFHADVTERQLPLLLKAGQDGQELGAQVAGKGRGTVELYLTDAQADALRRQGVHVTEHELSATASKRVLAAAQGVFRPYSGKGGLEEEILRTARAHPGLTKPSPSGRRSTARTSSRSSSPGTRGRPGTAPSLPCCTCPTSTRASGSHRR